MKEISCRKFRRTTRRQFGPIGAKGHPQFVDLGGRNEGAANQDTHVYTHASIARALLFDAQSSMIHRQQKRLTLAQARATR